MTISNTSRTAGPFIGNGITKRFPFQFKVFSRDDILVAQTVTATGAETIKVLDSDYAVSLNSNQDSNPGGFIDMVVAPPVGTTLAATSNISLVQALDLTNQGGFYPKVINDALDRMVINIQQLAAKIGHGLNIGSSAITEAALNALSTVQLIGGNSGASLVGFGLSGLGAITRTVLDKLRERVSVKDFGAKGDGATNDTAAFLKCRDYCVANGAIATVPDGTYRINAGTNFAANGFQMIGVGAKPTLQIVGAGLGFVLDAGDAGAHMDGLRMENIRIVGNPDVSHAFYSRGIVRSKFSHIEVRECFGSAFNLIFSVSNVYTHMVYSAYNSTTKPARGFILADSGAGYYCADNTFINCIAEDAINMIGVLLFAASGNTFLGGTFEACNKGVVIFSGCRRNTFKGVWFELNAASDLENDGVLNTFEDCYFGSAPPGPNIVIGLGQGTQFRGGYIRTAQLQSTSSGTVFFGCGFDENLTGTLGITGSGSYKAIGLNKVNGSGDIVGLMADQVGEGGNWTPSLRGDAVAGAQTYSIQVGRYQKVGKLVHFQAYIVITAIAGSTGNAMLAGFPFPIANIGGMYLEFAFTTNSGVTFTGTRNRLVVQVSPGSNYGVLIENMDGALGAAFPVAQLGPGTYAISGTYIVD